MYDRTDPRLFIREKIVELIILVKREAYKK